MEIDNGKALTEGSALSSVKKPRKTSRPKSAPPSPEIGQMTQQQIQQIEADKVKPKLPDLGIYRMFKDVQELKKATDQASCYDLRAYVPQGSFISVFNLNNKKRKVYSKIGSQSEVTGIYLEPQDRALIPTGIQMDIPIDYSFRIHPRSGDSWKFGVKLNNSEGIIDSDYVDQVYISVYNSSGARVYIEHQDRVAQGELQLDCKHTTRRLRKPPKQKTNRAGGLGHTGNK